MTKESISLNGFFLFKNFERNEVFYSLMREGGEKDGYRYDKACYSWRSSSDTFPY